MPVLSFCKTVDNAQHIPSISRSGQMWSCGLVTTDGCLTLRAKFFPKIDETFVLVVQNSRD